MKNFITPTRHFNDLKDCGSYFIKSSINLEKIAAEIKFYENLTDKSKLFYPKYLGKTNQGKWPIGYKVEKIENHDCSSYFTGIIPTDTSHFDDLFVHIDKYINSVPKLDCSKDNYIHALENQILNRNINRVNSLKSTFFFTDIDDIFKNEGFKGLDDFLENLHHEILLELTNTNNFELWFSHGDLCLSNIILHNDKLYLVDPRGLALKETSSYLVPVYDLAKLSQCIYGGYDFINYETKEKFIFNLKDKFEQFISHRNISLKLIRLIESSHFIAMLPLHIDSTTKVQAFANQALKSYKEAI